MKALAVERNASQWPREAVTALDSEAVESPWCLPVTLMTDSAAVRCGHPLFVPDFATGWEVEIVPCFTVCRLGKSISRRFAGRYVDTVGLVGRLLPPAAAGQRMLPALASNFDGAFCLGEKFVFHPDEPLALKVEGLPELTIDYNDLHLEDTVALVSRYMMLKMGDLIMPCNTGLRVPARQDTIVRAALNGADALCLKIK